MTFEERGGADGAYLNAYSWVWDNALPFRGEAAGRPALHYVPDTMPEGTTGDHR
ncbi:hypothetical protein ACOKM5_09440 [Streptomyces sp. BH097]|uniref:hypothetical protein n=1 Tax=unclassified Streptomyces TaxID=2593676 RepID=UPI003BB788E0